MTQKATTDAAVDLLSAWDMVDSIHMLLYGVSGSGKTTLAATFPGPILWLVCSGGNKPGELRSIDTPENRKKITARIVKSSDQFRTEVGRANNFATVILDHASGLSDLILKELLGIDEIPAQKSWGLATQQQYGQLAMQCKESFRTMLNLSCHVVIIAQERVFGGKEEGVDPDIIKPTVGAALTPSVTGWLGPACDFVVQSYKAPAVEKVTSTIGGKSIVTERRGKGVVYCLRTGPHETFQTKFRVNRSVKLPEFIPDPSYDKIQSVINGTYES